ncbi:VOC family protein [Vibrio algarum]|uniref:VOC family protein n=1 Tax=Vibrio algarum TaxID=3020714 RepID=A0ABT4YX77_9VIBR|nr:VOC family protein [Vibrio sp. KJ40-1]MDB1126184.1 VOC family protein [Vibrio sp. KJ40-1]
MSNDIKPSHNSINYIEFAATEFVKTKAFFSRVFDWTFEDYGEEYMAFTGIGLTGGFYYSQGVSVQEKGGALLVFYSDNLSKSVTEVKEAGGIINRDIFEFPGGRRFHFIEPSGNEMAVWSDK